MDLNDALRTYYGVRLEAFLEALEAVLSSSERLLDPGDLPDGGSGQSFFTRYDHLREEVAQTVSGSLPARRYDVACMENASMEGRLRRQDIEALREDVRSCLEALFSSGP